jgi:hypothetical protein
MTFKSTSTSFMKERKDLTRELQAWKKRQDEEKIAKVTRVASQEQEITNSR